MGSAIAAQLANAGLEVLLLDLPGPSGDRDRHARQGIERARRARPPAFQDLAAVQRVQPGNLEDHLSGLGEAEWVVEAVVEDPEVKKGLFERIAPVLSGEVVLSTNTSGLSIADLAGALPETLRSRFLATHWFNPPRWMPLVELVPAPASRPGLLEEVGAFLEDRLGKETVPARDAPLFLANRLGCHALLDVLHRTLQEGLTVEAADAWTGPWLGRPGSATFRTLDLVGLDTFARVVTSARDRLRDRPGGELFELPGVVEGLLERGWTGVKAGGGFYRRGKDGLPEVLDLETLEYREARPEAARDPLAELQEAPLAERLRAVLAGESRAASFLRGHLLAVLGHAAACIPEVTDRLEDADRSLRLGFGWEAGPFELWDLLGPAAVASRLEEAGSPPPAWVGTFLRSGEARLLEPAQPGLRVWRPVSGRRETVPPPPLALEPASCPEVRGLLPSREDVRLRALPDEIWLLETTSPLGILGTREVAALRAAVARLDEGGARALVFAGGRRGTSAGADLRQLLRLAEEAQWHEAEAYLRSFQELAETIRRSRRPVVVLLHGPVLGAGLELALAAHGRLTHAEARPGLVEARAGLVPGGGGIRELLERALLLPGRRASRKAFEEELRRIFRLLGGAVQAGCAAEARSLGLLDPGDPVSFSRPQLLERGRRLALALDLLGHAPRPPSPPLPLPGSAFRAVLEAEPLDPEPPPAVRRALAALLAGRTDEPETVDGPGLLDREREAFLSLLGEPSTRDRMRAVLESRPRPSSTASSP